MLWWPLSENSSLIIRFGAGPNSSTRASDRLFFPAVVVDLLLRLLPPATQM